MNHSPDEGYPTLDEQLCRAEICTQFWINLETMRRIMRIPFNHKWQIHKGEGEKLADQGRVRL